MHSLLRPRILAAVLAALMVAASQAQAVVGPVVVFDADTGQVLIEDRAGESWSPASLTKLMTAYLVFEALEAGELQLDQSIPVSQAAAQQPPSKIGISAGRSITVDLALRALLVRSGNDIAVVLAEAVSGSEANFIDEMNATAERLAMHGTRFANPHGLPDPLQVTTARDMGLLAGVLQTRFPQSRGYYSAPSVEVGGVMFRSRNNLMWEMPEADGMKTGFVCDSGFNLVASATFGDRRLISVVLGGKSAPSRNVLSRVLLESAEALAQQPAERPTLVDIASTPAGAGQPHSMSRMVCEGIDRMTLTPPHVPENWGVSFGRYAYPLTAEAVLVGRLLAIDNPVAGRPRGIVEDDLGYLALVWNMSQRDALALCERLPGHRAPCQVMSPHAFAQLAPAAGVADSTAEAAPQDEGSQ
ncbi:MAG TPA: D-alanyl-D-alanine carboxypeptidase family protein [Aestuariivirgaceae bacterium]|nr:D-alanyl-D-alanine carboxypeptidase family protein [Aestuariivirgaceae bacterium]